MPKILKIKTGNFDKNNICVPKQALENRIPNWFTSISDSEVCKKGTVLILGDSIVQKPIFFWSKNIRYVLLSGTVAT